MSENSIARSRIKLLTVLGFFLVPFFIAIVGYFFFPSWFATSATVNHAPLVQPVVTLKPFTNLHLDESQLTLDSLKRHWSIIHRLEGACDERCEKALYNSRQTRFALGKDTHRVQRILLGSDIRLLESAGEKHPDMSLVLRIQGGLDHQLIPITAAYDMGADDALLVDPLGNVMMVIPVDLNPTDLLKDLKKLLKLSKIG